MKLSIIEAILMRLVLDLLVLLAVAVLCRGLAADAKVGGELNALRLMLAVALDGVVVLVTPGVGRPLGVVGRDNVVKVGGATGFDTELPDFGAEVLLLPFFEDVWCGSFFTEVGDAAGGSSSPSFPLRFLPCLRHGSSGVARTRTSHGNLSIECAHGLPKTMC